MRTLIILLLFTSKTLNAQSGVVLSSNLFNYNLKLKQVSNLLYANKYNVRAGYISKSEKTIKGLWLGYTYEGLSYRNDSSIENNNYLSVIPSYKNNSHYISSTYFNNKELFNLHKLSIYFNTNVALAYRFNYVFSKIEHVYNLNTNSLYITQVDDQSQSEKNIRLQVSTGVSAMLPLTKKINIIAASDLGMNLDLYFGNRISSSVFNQIGGVSLKNSSTTKINRWYYYTNRVTCLGLIYFFKH